MNLSFCTICSHRVNIYYSRYKKNMNIFNISFSGKKNYFRVYMPWFAFVESGFLTLLISIFLVPKALLFLISYYIKV